MRRSLDTDREKENQKSSNRNNIYERLNLNDSFEAANSGSGRAGHKGQCKEGVNGKDLLGRATGSRDLELTRWLQGAHKAGPGTDAPLASPLPGASVLDCRSSPGPSRERPPPSPGHSGGSLQKGFGLCGRSGSRLPTSSLQGSAHTSFRSGGNYNLVVCKGKGAVFPSRPPSCSEPIQALFPIPSLTSNPSLHLQCKAQSKAGWFQL